jgi:TcpE family
VELPTYTNIWKIEKRLYKLYDFRLPMPLPVGQLAVFVAIAVPYMLILTMVGMPFSHTWFWLYVLPPAVLAWLVTRPVLEGKRLPELVLSQLRYLSEPGTWCRMAPLAEKDEITVVARVWRRAAASALPQALHVGTASAVAIEPLAAAGRALDVQPVDAESAGPEAAYSEAADAEAFAAQDAIDIPVRPVWPISPAIHAPAASAAAVVNAPNVGAPGGTGPADAAHDVAEPGASTEMPIRVSVPARLPEVAERSVPEPGAPQRFARERPPSERQVPKRPVPDQPASEHSAPEPGAPQRPAPERPAAGRTAPERTPPERTAPERLAPKSPQRPGARPGLTVRTDGRTGQPLHLVERSLRSSSGGGPANGWHDRVVVVPGGHRPGKPDQVQRDQARAQMPLAGPARVVVLGCTAGAGQTVTTLLTGHLLAGLRGEAVAVLDLSAGPGSLTEQARQIPRLLPGRRNAPRSEEPGPSRERGLQVVTADNDADEPADAGKLIDAVVTRYPLTLADPAAAQVPRALHVADQLVLVAPASPDAAGALAMTLEWLDGNGHGELARRAVAVLNGVSANSAAHTDKAAAVATGLCRAIVRVPWDGGLSGHGPLGVAAVQAYTALAGVLVSGLAVVAASPPGQSRSGGQ